MADKGTVKALQMLRRLPRLTLGNLVVVPGEIKRSRRQRGINGGKNYGTPTQGMAHHGKHCPVGYEGGTTPFQLKVPVQKWAKERFDISYVPLTLRQLQLMLDTDRINSSIPIDVTQLNNTGLVRVDPRMELGGIMLEEEGIDCFCRPVNLEVQFASEAAIAAVERAGGVITTAYYDPYSLTAAASPINFFKRGLVIPRRQLPPQRHVEYYSDPRNRGYLADPDLVAGERLKLSQKYGYSLPDLSSSPIKDLLLQRKDPRQVFYGLQPGWLVNLTDKVIIKPKQEHLNELYSS